MPDKNKSVQFFETWCIINKYIAVRHGREHNVSPSDVNYRANLWALKEEGCTCVLVTTACGSLRENIHPGEVVILDQFIDWYVCLLIRWLSES